MNLGLRLRLSHRLPNGFFTKPILSPLVKLNFGNINVVTCRGLSQPARKEDEEEEEVEYDQRRLPADYDSATFDPTEHRSPPSQRVFRLVDEIVGLTLAEIAELGSIIMKKRGMTDPPTVGVMKPGVARLDGMAMKGGPAVAAGKEEKKPEKTVFELKLESYEAAAKIKVIKEVRSFTDLGLKEAKGLVENTPTVLKAGVSKEEGEQIIEKMKALGAKVVME
ncbi:Ribosomal_L12 domain-containing protein [Cephalotus follicularis]|uniref:Ribosomal_L12 domain-containing protein n=1 Tax=Cephalotus follicularis TaxID=3775 RepID=A0A1Q3DAI6_CEPFO|nr:Ribosomal_L12 domain-containing protein [Cephalotus follicularis]